MATQTKDPAPSASPTKVQAEGFAIVSDGRGRGKTVLRILNSAGRSIEINFSKTLFESLAETCCGTLQTGGGA